CRRGVWSPSLGLRHGDLVRAALWPTRILDPHPLPVGFHDPDLSPYIRPAVRPVAPAPVTARFGCVRAVAFRARRLFACVRVYERQGLIRDRPRWLAAIWPFAQSVSP